MEMKAVKLRVARLEKDMDVIKKQLELITKFLLGWSGGLDLSRRLLAVEKGANCTNCACKEVESAR